MQRRAAAQYGGTERHSSWSYDLFPSASRTARCHLVRANRSFPKPSAARIWLTSQPHFRRERWLHSKISGRWLGRQFQNPHLCFLRPNPRGRRRFKHRQNLLLIAGIGTHQSIPPLYSLDSPHFSQRLMRDLGIFGDDARKGCEGVWGRFWQLLRLEARGKGQGFMAARTRACVDGKFWGCFSRVVHVSLRR